LPQKIKEKGFNMMKHYFLLMAWVLSTILFAGNENPGLIEGIVLDKKTGDMILGTSIYMENTKVGNV